MIEPQKLIQAYRDMLLIRRFEEKAGQLYGMGLIGGFCHLYIGQEAVVVGLQAAITPNDSIITSYRDHGHMLACGMEARGVMAELTGRATGYSKGKGGSMHMFSREKNFFGGHGIVGAQVPIGTGMAFAHGYKNDNAISMVYMGDGAANQGQVFEALNMAALWNVGVVYVIEDNQYSMGTSIARHTASVDFSKRGAAFDIEGRTVDGMDFFNVYEAGLWAADQARNHKKPVILHVKTYRYRGHSMSDPGRYRTKDEIEDMKQNRDPIDQLRQYLVENTLISEENLKIMEKEIKDVVNDSAEFAKISPEPDLAELYTDIYCESVPLCN